MRFGTDDLISHPICGLYASQQWPSVGRVGWSMGEWVDSWMPGSLGIGHSALGVFLLIRFWLWGQWGV